MVCIHEHADWPRFRWSAEAITDRLATVRYRQGRLIGRMESLGLDQQNEALLRTLTEDVVKSSNMEGSTRARYGRRLPGSSGSKSARFPRPTGMSKG
jgi:Fic family protein